jgi:hypothetical protein
MTLAKMRVNGAVAAMRKEIMLATDPGASVPQSSRRHLR